MTKMSPVTSPATGSPVTNSITSPAGSNGFTLVELIIVVAIMAVLASSAMPLYELNVQREKEQELRAGLRQIREAIDAYKRAVNEGRVARKADESDYPSRLEDLVEGVPDIKDPAKHNIYFIRRLPRDPMSANPALSNADTWGKRAYESPPDDPQEGDDVFDVYSRSRQTGLNGISYNRW
ncbi:MAG: type II secretion system protein [Nitrosomonadaceae bacterium]|jgi:general secretion pathway protein G|nr:type II secretion system protein [Nitrosospira sp.]MDW7597637.1 type II secretion system protein [Nitrosomonadaceae bacterium]MBI0411368.1 type II secretion system protein [Nitrosospira sp.]MDW7619217.1 type II secretion system protein [Nitrosomonadaceae bacterium]MDW7647250.1 type II secretion system protein [Nitrosomonadaceae bacterium]